MSLRNDFAEIIARRFEGQAADLIVATKATLAANDLLALLREAAEQRYWYCVPCEAVDMTPDMCAENSHTGGCGYRHLINLGGE